MLCGKWEYGASKEEDVGRDVGRFHNPQGGYDKWL